MKFKVRNIEFSLWDKKYSNDLLFIALSGSDAYGWAKKKSDIDTRLVWIPDILQALSIHYRGNIKHSKNEFDNGTVDLVQMPMYKFLDGLTKGNGNYLENLFQDKLVSQPKLVKELQQLTIENLHTSFLKHYIRYYNKSLSKDMTIPARLTKYGLQKLLLSSFRVLRAGIILAEHKEVVYNLDKQEEYLPNPFWSKIREDYLNNQESYYLFTKHAKAKLEFLEQDLDSLIKTSKWYKVFPDIVYDRWIKDYLVGKI